MAGFADSSRRLLRHRVFERLGLSAFIQGPNASNVTSCSDLNQPGVYLRSTMLRYGASSTSWSSPALTRCSATLPMPHGATSSSTTSDHDRND